MTEPEISRRCRFCGASIRVRGFFCPQCGQSTADQPTDSASEEQTRQTEEVPVPLDTVSVDLNRVPTADIPADRMAETVALYPLPDRCEVGAAKPGYSAADVTPPQPTLNASAPANQPLGSRSRAMSQVPVDVKRGLGKVREISTVMLDEAAYDPSARFVLVAAVLFILFLIILILSEMMR